MLRDHDLVEMEHPLTDSGKPYLLATLEGIENSLALEWDQIKGDLEACLYQTRIEIAAQSRERQMGERIRKYIQPAYMECIVAQVPNPIFPLIPEVALMDEFRTVLESVPLDEDILAGAFDDAIAKLPKLVAQWKGSLDDALLDILRQSTTYSGQDLPEDVLWYASSIFKCQGCKAPLSYPTVLAHQCFFSSPLSRWVGRRRSGAESRVKKGLFTDEKSETTTDLVLENYTLYSLWEPGNLLAFHEPAHLHTMSLLDLLGLDRATSYREMLERNPYVECRCKCFDRAGGKEGRIIMRWTCAVSKYLVRRFPAPDFGVWDAAL